MEDDTISFVIAEVSVNHNGDFSVAKKMITEAANCGADAVKFQTFWGLESLEKYEFNKQEWLELKTYCDRIGIEFMSSAHWGSPLCGYKDEDYDVIDFVDNMVKRHKIASPYLTNKKYCRYVDNKGKPILLSTAKDSIL